MGGGVTMERAPAPREERPSREERPFSRILDCRHGPMIVNENDLGVGTALSLYGEWCEGEIELLTKLVRPGDIVVDGGAHLGTHTIPLARSVGPQGAILSFEPQRIVFQALSGNVALASLTNVHAFHAALGESPGFVEVPVLDPEKPGSPMTVRLGDGIRGEPVPLVRLDSIEIHRLRLVKLDIEGMEEKALRGASGLLGRFSPILYVECDKPEKEGSLMAYIHSLGYALFFHRPPVYRIENYRRNRVNHHGAQRSENLLCLLGKDMMILDEIRDPYLEALP